MARTFNQAWKDVEYLDRLCPGEEWTDGEYVIVYDTKTDIAYSAVQRFDVLYLIEDGFNP